MLTIPTIIALVIMFLGIFISAWRRYVSSKNISLAFLYTDVLLLCLGSFFIISRLAGLLYSSTYIGKVGWSFIFASQVNDEVVWFSQFPWLFLKVTDGHLFFLEAISGVLLGLFLHTILSKYSHELDKTIVMQNRIQAIISYFILLLPLSIAATVNGHLGQIGVMGVNLPAGVLFVLANIIGIIICGINKNANLNFKLLLLIGLQIGAYILFTLLRTGNGNLVGAAVAGLLLSLVGLGLFVYSQVLDEKRAQAEQQEAESKAKSR